MHKVILLDCYQTLIDVPLFDENDKKVKECEGWERFIDLLNRSEKSDVKVSDFLSLLTTYKTDFYVRKDREYYHHNLLDLVLTVLTDDFELSFTKQKVAELIYEYRKISRGSATLYRGVEETLSRLAKRYTLALASYTQSSFTKPELEELGIEKYFSHFIFSSDIGLRKTSVEFYNRCLNVVGKSSNDCIMVGDNYDTDVLVPKGLGIKTVWVENPFIDFQCVPTPNERPRNTVNLREFGKLEEVIKRMV